MSRPGSAVLLAALALALAVACNSGPPEKAHVRFAHLVPDAPAVDLCLKPADVAAYGTPYAGGAGLSYPSLTARGDLDAGTYSVRLVAGGATSCATSLNGLGDLPPVTLGEGATQTLALIGRYTGTGAPNLTLRAYDDRTVASASSSIAIRAVNAAPGSSAQSAGVLSFSVFQPFAVGVTYPNASAYGSQNVPPGVTNGQALLSARDSSSGAEWASGTFSNLSDTGVYTMFVIGIPGQTGTAGQSLLLCSDRSVNCVKAP